MMNVSALRRLLQVEDLNFLLTNRVPRMLLTRWMGVFSRVRSRWLTRLSIGIWRLFTDLDLSDSKKQRFESLHECFTRELVVGARPIDRSEDVLTSPCDAIVGACGRVEGTTVFQAKGFPYALRDLFGPTQSTLEFVDGTYVTLRLTSAMYHRFHAPCDCEVEHVTYLAGDTWNVNPIALSRVEKLYCRNERAVLRCRTDRGNHLLAIVPIAAILVASIRLHFVDVLLHMRYRGPHEIGCDALMGKGQEMGWFEHGSTIVVFAPKGFELAADIVQGKRIRMGEALLRMPADNPTSGETGAETGSEENHHAA